MRVTERCWDHGRKVVKHSIMREVQCLSLFEAQGVLASALTNRLVWFAI